MNFKRYHVSKNLFDKNNADIYSSTNISTGLSRWAAYEGIAQTVRIPCSANTTYAISIDSAIEQTIFRGLLINTDNVPVIENPVLGTVAISSSDDNTAVFTTLADTKYLILQVSAIVFNDAIDSLMLVAGSQPLPYEPYDTEVWHDVPYYIHKTSTDTITTLPADIYANDTTATVGLKGQMEQSGAPSPATPIQPQECGDLETTGEHTGQYKIPILYNNTTTNVYLGEVQTTRKIVKYEFTGQETWSATTDSVYIDKTNFSGEPALGISPLYCSHYPNDNTGMVMGNSWWFRCYDSTSVPNWKTYLQQQYAAGTPVTVWYVLATPTTGIVNEPLRKIGDYADEVSGISIPTIAGANTISVDTTLQPSEVTVNYKGWHPVRSVHEYDSNYTIVTMQALTIAQLQTHTISDLQGGEWS